MMLWHMSRSFLSAFFIIAISGSAQSEDIETVKRETALEKAKLERLNAKKALKAASAAPSSKISILSVTYGIGEHTCSADGLFATVCKGQTKCDVVVNNSMCGDPVAKPKNSAKINYHCGDPEKITSIEVQEDTKAYLTCP